MQINPFGETPSYCSSCGIETETSDMLCDDCDCVSHDDYSDPDESHWAGEDRHYYANE